MSLNKVIQKYSSKKMGKTKGKKKYNMAILRKFRIAVIAVHFALLFPKYANRFTLKRFRNHEKSLEDIDKFHTEVTRNYVDSLLGVNMSDLVQSVQVTKSQNKHKHKQEGAKIMIS